MLSAQAAKAALSERRTATEQATRRPVRAILGRAAAALVESPTEPGTAVARLEALGRRGRRAAFGSSCPGMGAQLAAVFENAAGLTYQGDWNRRPFRAPRDPSIARERILRAARSTVPELAAHAAEPAWLARWAGHLVAEEWRVSAHLVGWLLAAAVDEGDDQVYDLLLASTDGSDDVATMGRHVPIALLCANRPEGWERVEALLLGAQRQEGLRQSILEVVDEAHPEALRRMLRLILEHDLSRFASVARALAVWLGLEVLAGDRRQIDALAERALGFLDDPAARAGAVGDAPPLDAFVALWATATEDVHAAIDHADEVLGSSDPERRFAAAQFLAETRIAAAHPGLVRALGDADLRVASVAVEAVQHSILPEAYDVIEGLLERIPKRAAELEPVAWYGPLPPLKREDVGRILVRHRDPPDLDRVLPHRTALGAWERRYVVERVAEARLTPVRREALLDSLGDASPDVREHAIAAAGRIELAGEEALALEPLLRRKPGDLRRGVIELILGRGPRWALAAADRLAGGTPQERLGAVELLGRIAAGDSELAGTAAARLAALETEEGDEVVEAASRRARGDGALTELTEADGFGLFDPAALTPLEPPTATGFLAATAASRRVLGRLDDLIGEHAEVEVESVNRWGPPAKLLLGAVEYPRFVEHHRMLRRGETDVEVPLLAVWQRFAAELDADARDADGLHLLRAALSCAEARERHGYYSDGKAGADLGIRRVPLVQAVLGLLLELSTDESTLAGALDAAEAEVAALGKRGLRRRLEWAGPPTAAALARELAMRPASDPYRDQLRRHWRLERWLAEGPGFKLEDDDLARHARHSDRVLHRPPVEVVVRAFERGAASEADLVDHLVGPRGRHWTFRDLGDVSSRRRAARTGAGAATRAVVERIRERVVAMELARGEAPTQAAQAVHALSHSGGLDVLAGAVAALGRERFVRGWSTDGEGRAAVFSHMVATSYRSETDTPERFASAVGEARIPARRLREVACYAPQWAGHVEAALGVPGLADAVWWLHAHTKDDRWTVEADLREEWARTVGDRTDLSAEQLVDGAVDVRWFTEARARIGDAELEELLRAAKYGSTAGGHKRAELFARAMRGDLSDRELLERIEAKRHQDSVRALGLLPLPAAAEARRTALARRYAALNEFRRGSRAFGKQRQGSEGRATDIALENLARTAGFSDPVRLTWALEAEATADLAGDGVAVEHDGATVSLRVDADGRPEVTVRRGEKTLKSVPGKLRKVPEVKALTARATELRRQRSRIRASLEQAMIRGDELTGDELARYREHVLLWPALSALVLVGEELCGFPHGDGRVLRDHAGQVHAVGNTEVLRIAHPLDLLERDVWPAVQADVLARRLVQPFKQVFRELYLPVEAERAESGGSRRYAGHQVQPGRARALLSSRGWRIDEFEGARKTDHHAHVSAALWFLAGFGTPVDVEPPTLEEVRFTSTRDGEAIALADVPPRLFSETMRDLDLVVSVAHVSGFDPEASHSSVEMRAALVTETAALLGYDNVTIQDGRALIDGEISRYSVHLGSAGVHRLPGGAVCIVPIHAQQRGRVFLPFADDDPKTAEVVAKVLMLARDAEIRDPTILEQLRR